MSQIYDSTGTQTIPRCSESHLKIDFKDFNICKTKFAMFPNHVILVLVKQTKIFKWIWWNFLTLSRVGVIFRRDAGAFCAASEL
jgi:hypothetical protein